MDEEIKFDSRIMFYKRRFLGLSIKQLKRNKL